LENFGDGFLSAGDVSGEPHLLFDVLQLLNRRFQIRFSLLIDLFFS
jgi:hypothetical protein